MEGFESPPRHAHRDLRPERRQRALGNGKGAHPRPDNTIHYSTVSVWEVLLKHARRLVSIPFDEADFSEGCKEAGFVPLGLSDKHVLAVRTLSRPSGCKEHNDPFDRLLLSQAKVENMSFLTHDELIPGCGEICVIPV